MRSFIRHGQSRAIDFSATLPSRRVQVRPQVAGSRCKVPTSDPTLGESKAKRAGAERLVVQARTVLVDSARQSRHVCQQPSNVGGCRQHTNRGGPLPCIAASLTLARKVSDAQQVTWTAPSPIAPGAPVTTAYNGSQRRPLSSNPPRSLLIQEPRAAVQRQGANLRNCTHLNSIRLHLSEVLLAGNLICACIRVHPSRASNSTSDTLLMPLAAIRSSLSSAKELTQIGGRAVQTGLRSALQDPTNKICPHEDHVHQATANGSPDSSCHASRCTCPRTA